MENNNQNNNQNNKEYSIQIIKFKNCNKDLRLKLLNTFFTCFNNSMDPCFYDETIIKILYYGKNIAGMICGIDNYELLKFNSEDSYYIKYDKKGMFIYNLCINEKHRKKGFGKILLKLFINKYSKVVDYFHTQIFKNNIASRFIFTSQNFVENKKLKDKYENEFSVFYK
tara:strand:+ start:495 stop:1001 length:507 start_codon:yes stop_codon:yes gene_type:complete